MTKWNKTGKIKAIILVVLFISNLFFASPVGTSIKLFQVLIPLVFGALALPLIVKLNTLIRYIHIEKPNWNDNPLSRSSSLAFLQFGAWFMLANGASILIGSALILQVFSLLGLSVVFFGVGMLIGIELTIKWFGK